MTPEEIQRYSDKFDEMCADRHAMGAEKYGPVNFMSVDTIRMMKEEITDMANYARYMFIKLSIIEEAMTPPTTLGVEGFIGRDQV
jgi:hypothetical protein